MTAAPLTHHQITEILGEIDDDKAVAIIETGATQKDLEEVRAWLAGEDDVMGAMAKPLHGVAAEIFEILAAAWDEEDER